MVYWYCSCPSNLVSGGLKWPRLLCCACPYMFRRILSEEEERAMVFVDACAVEMEKVGLKSSVSATVKFPRYLKKIRHDKQTGKLLVLASLGKARSSCEVAVSVAAFEPITRLQYEEANEAWPCHFYKPYREQLDCKNAEEITQMVLDTVTVPCDHYCSQTCAIFDGNEMLVCCTDKEFIIGHAVTSAISTVSKSKRGYLCTGYTAVMYREPCTSCAMALVHGRIKRAILLTADPNGPFSRHKLNHNKNLNHRFDVYIYSNG